MRRTNTCIKKRLTAFGDNTFEYDGRGRRIKKNGVRYYYDFEDKLIASGDGMQFFYDNIGVAGFKYNGAYYTYKRDIQNNVTGILDNLGNQVVQYDYDAWGNQTVTDTSGIDLGTKNPFRYRSYFYDTETGLYFLKTRYYDPTTCRFLNRDSVHNVAPVAINGLNLYAYCFNNPVNYVDYGGWFPKKISFRIDQKGTYDEHVHFKYDGKNYTWYRIGHKAHHGWELGYDSASKTLKKKLKESGLPDDYFKKMSIVQIPNWQESFGIYSIPSYQEGFSYGPALPNQEGFSSESVPPYQEGFSSPKVDVGNIVLIAVGAAAVIAFVALAFFTGGQSLWGLLAFA